MASPQKVRVAIIGLGFGAEFIPIYQNHPHAEMYAICQRSEKLKQIGDHFGIAKRYTKYEEVLADPDVDAVHINTPIPDHAPQAMAGLQAGKHVACTVPMATTVEECRRSSKLAQKSGKKYMMMETVVYSREFLFVKQLYESGELGRIQFLQASHQQEMAGWPGYWEGLPPMHYATHCVGPCLALPTSEAENVVVSRLGPDRRAADRRNTARRLRSRRPHSSMADAPLGCESIARCSTPRGNIAKASTSMARSSRSSGRDRRRGAGAVTRRKARRVKGARLCRSPAQGDPPLHDQRGLRHGRNAAPVVQARRRPRRLASRTWPTSSSRAMVEDRPPRPDAGTSANWKR